MFDIEDFTREKNVEPSSPAAKGEITPSGGRDKKGIRWGEGLLEADYPQHRESVGQGKQGTFPSGWKKKGDWVLMRENKEGD